MVFAKIAPPPSVYCFADECRINREALLDMAEHEKDDFVGPKTRHCNREPHIL